MSNEKKKINSTLFLPKAASSGLPRTINAYMLKPRCSSPAWTSETENNRYHSLVASKKSMLGKTKRISIDGTTICSRYAPQINAIKE